VAIYQQVERAVIGRNCIVRRAVTSLVLLATVLASTCDAHTIYVNSIEVDGKSFRIDGIDTLERDQPCLNEDAEPFACGIRAAEELDKFIAGRSVKCEDIRADPAYPKRRIGECSVAGIDLGHWLVGQGWALNLQPNAKGRFTIDEEDARAALSGLWKGCFVAPQDFRRWNKHSSKLLGANCPPDARDKLFPEEASMPIGCEIKAHYALRAWPYAGIYHLSSCGSYRRTKAKRWFCTEEAAVEAGFRKAYTCGWW
jgi:endonuclease YncB( thermonuclease family)